jgi:SAM-dependent methyltransferase
MTAADMMGNALEASFAHLGIGSALVVEFDDSEAPLGSEPLDVYFQSEPAFDPEYLNALELLAQLAPAPARVLDLGCGAGRFLRWWAKRGYAAMGLDYSEAAVRVARQYSGCEVRLGTLNRLRDSDLGQFGIQMLFGHNLGIGGTPEGVQQLLLELQFTAQRDGYLAVNSIDKTLSPSLLARKQVQKSLELGRYPGQSLCRVVSASAVSDWFPWIHAAPRDFELWAAKADWQLVEQFHRPGQPAFWSAVYQTKRGRT